MNKDEDCLIKWFWEKFNSCYLVKHEDYQESIFMFYDPQYIRKLKLANISGEKIKPKIDITGICLFEQDWKNMNFRCNYNEVWDYLGTNYSNKYSIVQSFIKNRLQEADSNAWVLQEYSIVQSFIKNRLQEADSNAWVLQEHKKMSSLTPTSNISMAGTLLQEHTKMSSLTPALINGSISIKLQEHTKMSSLTPTVTRTTSTWALQEHTKMSSLTPIPFINKELSMKKNSNFTIKWRRIN